MAMMAMMATMAMRNDDDEASREGDDERTKTHTFFQSDACSPTLNQIRKDPICWVFVPSGGNTG